MIAGSDEPAITALLPTAGVMTKIVHFTRIAGKPSNVIQELICLC
jgi:hypothetical protein